MNKKLNIKTNIKKFLIKINFLSEGLTKFNEFDKTSKSPGRNGSKTLNCGNFESSKIGIKYNRTTENIKTYSLSKVSFESILLFER